MAVEPILLFDNTYEYIRIHRLQMLPEYSDILYVEIRDMSFTWVSQITGKLTVC